MRAGPAKALGAVHMVRSGGGTVRIIRRAPRINGQALNSNQGQERNSGQPVPFMREQTGAKSGKT